MNNKVYKYGIDITNATLQTYAYEQGITKAVSEMTQMEKQQLRVLAILDQSQVSWGDLSDTINNVSNQVRVLKNSTTELSIIIGQLFNGAIAEILPMITGLTIALKRLLGEMAEVFGLAISMDSAGTGYNELGDEMADLTEETEELAEATEKLKSGLRAFDELKTVSLGSSSNVDELYETIDLTDAIIDATKKYESVWDEAFEGMENKANDFADVIYKVLKPLKGFVSDIAIGDWESVGEDVSAFTTLVFNKISETLEKIDWFSVGQGIGLILAGIDWTSVFKSVAKAIMSGLEGALELWQGSFDVAPIETAILTGIIALKWTGLGKALGTSMANAFALPGFGAMFKAAFSGGGGTSLDVIAVEFLGILEDAMEEMFPDWLNDLCGNLVAGIALGGAAGSWFPGAGTLAGAIVGGIIGAISTVKIDEKNIWQTLSDKLFNYNVVKSLQEDAAAKIDKAFSGDTESWFEIGGLIIEGIAEGLLASIGLITEPIGDLFAWIWEGFTGLFGGGDLELREFDTEPYLKNFSSKSIYETPTFASASNRTGYITGNASGSATSGMITHANLTNGAELELMKEQNQLLTEILNKDFISEDGLFNSVRNSANAYQVRTGFSAFAR